MKLYYVTNIFDLRTFENETTTLLKYFEICREMHIFSLFFLNQTNSTSLLVIHLKCTVVHYANLNSNSISKSLRDVEYTVSVFRISYLCLFSIFHHFSRAFIC